MDNENVPQGVAQPQPEQPTQPIESQAPVQPVPTATPAQPNPPAQPVPTATPAQPTPLMQPVESQPASPVQSIESQPTPPLQLIESEPTPPGQPVGAQSVGAQPTMGPQKKNNNTIILAIIAVIVVVIIGVIAVIFLLGGNNNGSQGGNSNGGGNNGGGESSNSNSGSEDNNDNEGDNSDSGSEDDDDSDGSGMSLQSQQRDTQRKNDMSRLDTSLVQYQTNNLGGLPNGPSYWKGTLEIECETTDVACKYVRDYMNIGAAGSVVTNEYLDPDGTPYSLYITENWAENESITPTFGNTNSSLVVDEEGYTIGGNSPFNEHIIYVVPGGICNEYSDGVVSSTERHFAIMYILESAEVYCMDDQ